METCVHSKFWSCGTVSPYTILSFVLSATARKPKTSPRTRFSASFVPPMPMNSKQNSQLGSTRLLATSASMRRGAANTAKQPRSMRQLAMKRVGPSFSIWSHPMSTARSARQSHVSCASRFKPRSTSFFAARLPQAIRAAHTAARARYGATPTLHALPPGARPTELLRSVPVPMLGQF